MRAAFERFARQWWSGEFGAAGRALALLAAPASWAWTAATRARMRAAAGASTRVKGLRVISVGNLAVGGTGKTPVAAWIARTVHSAGAPTCVLVGGAGADEGELHRRKNPAVPVWVDRDRVASAARARDAGARVAVVDDGFQHVRLARDLDVVLLSADDPFPGPTLPAGPYRESADALERADGVLVTRRSASADRAREVAGRVDRACPGLVWGAVHLADGAWARLDGTAAAPPPGDVLGVCGVARPDAFLAALRGRVAGNVGLVVFRDHHEYDEADVRGLRAEARGRPLVLTEKDAVKLAALGHLLGEAYVLADELRWDWGEEAVRARVLSGMAAEARP
jgi:tetraacyldisaccharide 4'-kinase